MLEKYYQLVTDYLKLVWKNVNVDFNVKIENFTKSTITWLGSKESFIIHTILFASSFSLYFMGVSFDKILPVVTNIVSLEAIYLSIFIQMSVNSQLKKVEEIQENVEEIQENVEDIQENVEDIQENVEDIQENVEDIQENVEEIQENVDGIQENVDELQKDVEEIQKEVDEIQEDEEDVDDEILVRIESTLDSLIKEVMELKKQSIKRR